VPLYDLCNFVAHLYHAQLSFSTIKCYLSGISFFSRINEFEDPTQKFIIKKMLEGIKRSRPKVNDARLPITKDLLMAIIRFLPFVCSSNYEIGLFQTAFSVAYHGLLRIGEIAHSGRHSRHAIRISDVSFLSNGLLQVRVPSSKTDQSGIGYLILLQPQPNPEICPCRLMRSYLEGRPPLPGPLFCHFDGSPLTRYQFVVILKKTLLRVGVNYKCYSSHSFRIGCATNLSIEGVSDSVIMQLGRWKSDSYKTYIRK